ncbi:MAG: M81 family metallopeptidase [Bacteroidales bacterium]|nr:M81 family metallopeptidase [Bacteroidales bacterium]
MKRITICLLSGLLLFLAFSCKPEHKQKRVLTLGIRHESNTFSTLLTKESDFKVLRGADVLKDQLWADVFKKAGIEIIPTLHAYAWPGGVVERTAFEDFKNEIINSIKNAGHLDGIYMDMHGALQVEGYEDAQTTLIKEIRDVVGNDILISGSFDLHGNLSPDFVKNIDLITAYRTAPHRDGAETKARAAQMLADALKFGWKPHIEYVVIPMLVPGEKSITEVEPLHSVYAQIPDVTKTEGLIDASIFAGYCWADLPRSAMRVFVVAKDKRYSTAAKDEAVRLAQQIWDSREKMVLDVPSGSIDEMISKSEEYTSKTVFISDSGDNTTAGAPGDNVQVLDALLRHDSKNVLVAGIVDPEALKECIKAGKGKKIKMNLGGKVDTVFGKPLKINAKVLFISPDSVMNTNRGAAVVETDGVKTVIIKTRRSFVEVNDFKEVGLNPLDFKIVVVKLGYLYPELRDIAPVHLIALTSGFCNLDMRTLPFKNVHRPCFPLDMDMVWKPI